MALPDIHHVAPGIENDHNGEQMNQPIDKGAWGRRGWTLMAYIFAGLGAAGAFIPLLPTTPFVLLSAACATRGSEALHRRLLEHPRFGPVLRDWEECQAIPLSGKLLSALGLLFAWVMSASRLSMTGQFALAIGFIAVSVYVWSRPFPSSGTRDTSSVDVR